MRDAATIAAHLPECRWTALCLIKPDLESRGRRAAHVQEAERLAETYAGAECPSISLGPTRKAPPNAATYLGRGAVEQLQGTLDAADPEKQAPSNVLPWCITYLTHVDSGSHRVPTLCDNVCQGSRAHTFNGHLC